MELELRDHPVFFRDYSVKRRRWLCKIQYAAWQKIFHEVGGQNHQQVAGGRQMAHWRQRREALCPAAFESQILREHAEIELRF